MRSAVMKYKKIMLKICDILEIIAALLVLLGILMSIFSFLKNPVVFYELMEDMSVFRNYLAQIFVIVIGIEFLQMLCRPNADNIIEVLIFLVARHMIVYETTTMEDFVSVISIAILCVLRKRLHISDNKEKIEKEDMNAEKIEYTDSEKEEDINAEKAV